MLIINIISYLIEIVLNVTIESLHSEQKIVYDCKQMVFLMCLHL